MERAAAPGVGPQGTARATIRLVALDLDGVVWRGGQVLPGVRDALEDILRRGLDLRYVSNNSTAHRETVAERLARLGLPAGTERVLTSGSVTGRWLRERVPEGADVMVVGEAGLLRELREAGFRAYHASGGMSTGGGAAGAEPGAALGGAAVTAATAVTAVAAAASEAAVATPASETTAAASLSTPTPVNGMPRRTPAAVVVGMDRSFSYRSLEAAQAAILDGALFVATNRDPTFPTPEGLLPGAGALVAALATATHREPAVMGKPGPALAEALAAVTGVPSAETLFVGDRLSTDIAMGKRAGMVTVLVLTGVTSEDDLRRAEAAGDEALPEHVISSLKGLPRLLDSLFGRVD